MNIAVVTGASSGIGREFVKQISQVYEKLDEIWVISRNEEKLKQLQIGLKHTLRIIPIDLCDETQRRLLTELLDQHKPIIKMLVNAAGVGYFGDFSNHMVEDESHTIQLNCLVLTELTHMCIPYMTAGSRIIQVASAAAFFPQPQFAVYAASKAFVLNFSRALNLELRDQGIYVTTLCPGQVQTPFLDELQKYVQTPSYKKKNRVGVTEVVRKAMRDSSDRNELSIYGFKMNILYLISKIIPTRLLVTITQHLNQKSKGNPNHEKV